MKRKFRQLDENYRPEKNFSPHPHPEYVNSQRKLWEKNPKGKTFLKFLNDITLPILPSNTVQYLSSYALRDYKVGFKKKNGKTILVYRGEVLKNKCDLFVISPTGTVYFGSLPKVQKGNRRRIDRSKYVKNNPRIQHSSFLCGDPVLFAGNLRTDKHGHIIRIDNASGHYKPQDPDIMKAIRFFASKGIFPKGYSVGRLLPNEEFETIRADKFKVRLKRPIKK